ncbi:MAG TPA: M48 family metallopeptidase [Myxococcaceae bacterium]|nr:M48 family metallopeptidase [Myxococcaceae bacterium]
MQPSTARKSYASSTAPSYQSSEQASLPSFDFPNEQVRARDHVASGTSLYTMLGYFIVAVVTLVTALTTMGGSLLFIGIGAIVAWFQARKVRALIRGSGIQVSADQLPELHAMVVSFAERLGMANVPEMYIVEESVQNGFAVKVGKKDIILLTDDMVWGALASRDPRALGFVVGHELAHVALGHTGSIRSTIRAMFRPLARADEFSADNVATRLVGDPQIAVQGLTLLTVGPQLLRYVNERALLAQVEEVCATGLSKKAERNLTHPLLLRRIGNVMR